MKNLYSIIWLIIAGSGIMLVIVGVSFGSIQGGRMYRSLVRHIPVKYAELFVSSEGNSDSGSRSLTLQNDSVCSKLNSTFKYFVEIQPDRPSLQSKFVRMSIYKDIKSELFISKTFYSGWVIYIADDCYKNDSLISVLREFAHIDH